MRRVIVTAVALSALAVGTASAQRDTPALNFLQALALAQADSSGLTLIYGRIEQAGGQWGFYFMTPDGIIIEKEIHGKTGRLIKNKQIDEIGDRGKINPKVIEALRVRTLTKLPNARYVEIALDKNKGVALGYDLVLGDNQLTVRVIGGSDYSSGNGWEVSIDLPTGRVR